MRPVMQGDPRVSAFIVGKMAREHADRKKEIDDEVAIMPFEEVDKLWDAFKHPYAIPSDEDLANTYRMMRGFWYVDVYTTAVDKRPALLNHYIGRRERRKVALRKTFAELKKIDEKKNNNEYMEVFAEICLLTDFLALDMFMISIVESLLV